MTKSKVSTRLALAFGLMVLLMATMTVTAFLNIRTIRDQVDLIARDRYAKIQLLGEIKDNDNLIARIMRNAIIYDDDAMVRKELGRAAKAMELVSARLGELAPRVRLAKAAMDQVLEAHDRYVAVQTRFVALVEAGNKADAKPLLTHDLRDHQLAYFARLDDLVHIQEGLMQQSVRAADTAMNDVVTVSLAVGAAAAVLALLLGTWIVRSITRELGGEPAEAASLARRVADGDLSAHIVLRPGDRTSLLVALKRMQDNLSTIVRDVRQNAEAVAAASGQISQGNIDLSSRTEEQASALQQTSASMRQLSAAVDENAAHAAQGSELAVSASSVATRGGEVVGQVVQTMKGINDASRKIADIISVIDGIAFQTNILALNAAVEAARAGEQGRGFAVVASEVRSLAQRSADAAKEIKTLITDSVGRVEQGSELVDQAGSTMEEVVQSIRRVTDLMGEISAASREQSAGVAQIGEAVNQMDQATQQNAALVEESAAAAESLKGQAQQLVGAVAVFSLGDGASFAARLAVR